MLHIPKYFFFGELHLHVLYKCTVQVRDKRPTHTQNARTIFAQTRVEKHVLKQTFACIWAHSMGVFPFVIHSHLWHSFPSSLNKRHFQQTALKIFLPTNKNSRYIFGHAHGVDKHPTFTQIFLLWTGCKNNRSHRFSVILTCAVAV